MQMNITKQELESPNVAEIIFDKAARALFDDSLTDEEQTLPPCMTQSNTIGLQTTPNGMLNAKAMKEAIDAIQNEKRKSELDRMAWRYSYLFGCEIKSWHMPIMNMTT